MIGYDRLKKQKVNRMLRDKTMYSKERQQEHISQIRRILVVKTDSSILDIKESLAKQRIPLELDKDYINKLVNKIRKERSKKLDHHTINKVLAEFQDEVEELKKRLWIIVVDPDSTEKDKIAAIRELRTSSKDLFDKMFDAGVFKRKMGEIESGKKLTPEEENLIKKAIELDYGKPKPEPKPDSTAEGGQDPKGTAVAEGENKPE